MKLTVLIAAAFFALNLQASTVIVLFNGEKTTETIQRDVGDGAGFVGTSTGEFSFTRTGGTQVGGPVGNFLAFCIEPREFVSEGSSYTYDFSDLSQGATNIGGMGLTKANLLSELFGRYYPVFTVSLDATHASALQIAAWEIVRENSGTLNVSSGNVVFQSPSDQTALTLAQTYLSSLNGTGPKANGLFALTAVGAQDVIVQVAAPEPVQVVTTGLGLIGLGLILRRKQNKKKR